MRALGQSHDGKDAAPAVDVSIHDLEQSVRELPHAGNPQASAAALEARARRIILNAYDGPLGAKRWQEDLVASIEERRKQLPKPTQRALWCWHAAATLLCCTVATFTASIPENFSDYSKSSVLNWAVDLATYSLFVTLLPQAHHQLNKLYAHYQMSHQPFAAMGARAESIGAASEPGAVHVPIVPSRVSSGSETPAQNLVELSNLQLFSTQVKHMAFFRQMAATHAWSFREELTYSNSTQYASMMVQKAYDSSLGKTALLTLLPLLMAKMPGATEKTGKFRGGNFGWEIAASWLVLTFHDDIRKYLVTPVATRVAYGFYALCAGAKAVGQSAYCCCGPEDGPSSTAQAKDVAAAVAELGISYQNAAGGSLVASRVEAIEGAKGTPGDDEVPAAALCQL
ncbi:MAG: hypothetical protein P1U34_04245 [Coxiellaceae bacterium]|nr:hypothetical protein [Coxiellaceae bacterium]